MQDLPAKRDCLGVTALRDALIGNVERVVDRQALSSRRVIAP